MVDLNALHRELHRALTTGSISALQRGLTLSRNLESLDPDDRATLATYLVHNFTDPQLLGLGRGGLNALRRAVASDAAERQEHALDRIDAALRQLPGITAWTCDNVWMLGVGVTPVTVQFPEVAGAPAGSVFVIVSSGDRKTGTAQLCEHYRECREELPAECVSALNRGPVSLLPIERLPGRALTLWSKLRSLAVRHVPAWA